jgi:2-oxopent-4-enoate/cis-2-oxohex-4-enoate hydratase
MTDDEPALSTREHQRLADVLFGAAASARTLAPLTTLYPDLTAADACRIRDLLLERRLAVGEQVIGAKVSLGPRDETRQPRFAWLTDGMLLANGSVDVSTLRRPRVEPKLAFRLARPLPGPVPTAGEVLQATEAVMPCLDVLDSGFDSDGRRLADDVAENGASTRVLMGDAVPPPADGHLLRLRVQLRVDGREPEVVEPLARRRSSVPALEAVSWLGGRLAEKGLAPGPGTLLLSQAIGSAIDLRAGARVIAHFAGLGTVQLDASDAAA